MDEDYCDQAMIPLDKLSRIDPNAELWTAMEKMGRDGVNQMPVMLGNDASECFREPTSSNICKPSNK